MILVTFWISAEQRLQSRAKPWIMCTKCVFKIFTIDSIRRQFSSINFIVFNDFICVWCGLWFVGARTARRESEREGEQSAPRTHTCLISLVGCYTIINIIIIPVFECCNRQQCIHIHIRHSYIANVDVRCTSVYVGVCRCCQFCQCFWDVF